MSIAQINVLRGGRLTHRIRGIAVPRRLKDFRRLLFIVAVVAGLAVTQAAPAIAVTPAAPRSASTQVMVQWDCVHFKVKPKTIETCGDDYIYFTGTHFTSYGKSTAHATSREHENLCVPDCVDGKWVTKRAVLTLYRVRNQHGHRVFTRASVHDTYHGKSSHFTVFLGSAF